jgi:SOS-response transcriptional repressor LexA
LTFGGPPGTLVPVSVREKIAEYVEEVYAERGIPPSVTEITQACNVKGRGSVHLHLLALVREGRLTRVERGNKDVFYLPARS